MSAKHTPGPWSFSFDDPDDCLSVKGRDGAEVVGGCGCCGSPRCSIADARLIAAAPQLLESLKELVAAGDNSCDPHNGDDVAAMIRFAEADREARAAIAAATGEQP